MIWTSKQELQADIQLGIWIASRYSDIATSLKAKFIKDIKENSIM